MKKLFAILLSLCLMCGACAAMADMEIPEWDKMPQVVMEDENTTVDEAAFEGEWVMNVAFVGTAYADTQTLYESYDYNNMPYVITKGMMTQDLQNEYGEFVPVEMPLTFAEGQMVGKDGAGRDFVLELLEDGNIVMSVFFPVEGEAPVCVTYFLVHPAE